MYRLNLLSGFFENKKNFAYFLWALPLIVPIFVRSPYYLDIIIYMLLWAGVGAAWNISSGYGGMLSIGHTAYFGIGAYTSSLLYVNYEISPWIGMLAGGIISVAAAFVLGYATLRLQGTFYTLATIAFASVLGLLTVAMDDITMGNLGIIIPYKPGFINMTFPGKIPYLILMFIFAFGMFIFCKLMEKRKLGSSLMAIRDNEDAANALGVNTTAVKIIGSVISAFFTSIGGTLFAQYLLFIDPSAVFNVNISVQFALVAIVGGLAVASGPAVGSIIYVLLTTGIRGYTTSFPGLSGLLYGILLIVIVMFLPEGLIPRIYQLITNSINNKKNNKAGRRQKAVKL